MIKSLVFVVFSMNLIIGFGQLEIRNTSLETPSEAILYRQLYNLIEFRSISNDSIVKVLIENDTVQRHINTFFIVPEASHESIEISAITIDGDTSIFTMAVKDFPKPKLMLGDLKSGNLTKAFLLENPGLLYEFPTDSKLPFIYPVKCDLVLINQKGKERLIKVNGNAFSEKQIKQLTKLEIGDKLVFKNSISSCQTCVDSRVEDVLTFLLVG